MQKLAIGGMAELYLARRSRPNGNERTVVLKRILPHLAEDTAFVSMFLDEARIAARLHHPNVIEILDLGAEGESYFIAMEYIHGEDMRRVAKRTSELGRKIPAPLAARVVASAARGLDYAHKRMDQSGRPLQIVHRDVSPQNILVSFDGDVKVVDFGIAKAIDKATVTASGVIKGKHAYMSPEQAIGRDIDRRTDVFALGVVLYELTTGTRLFRRATDLQTLKAVTECRVEPPSRTFPAVPAELDAIVLKALARDQNDRYQSAEELAEAIETWLGSRSDGSREALGAYVSGLFADRLQRERSAGQFVPTRSSPGMAGVPKPVPSPAPNHTVSMRSFSIAEQPPEPKTIQSSAHVPAADPSLMNSTIITKPEGTPGVAAPEPITAPQVRVAIPLQVEPRTIPGGVPPPLSSKFPAVVPGGTTPYGKPLIDTDKSLPEPALVSAPLNLTADAQPFVEAAKTLGGDDDGPGTSTLQERPDRKSTLAWVSAGALAGIVGVVVAGYVAFGDRPPPGTPEPLLPVEVVKVEPREEAAPSKEGELVADAVEANLKDQPRTGTPKAKSKPAPGGPSLGGAFDKVAQLPPAPPVEAPAAEQPQTIASLEPLADVAPKRVMQPFGKQVVHGKPYDTERLNDFLFVKAPATALAVGNSVRLVGPAREGSPARDFYGLATVVEASDGRVRVMFEDVALLPPKVWAAKEETPAAPMAVAEASSSPEVKKSRAKADVATLVGSVQTRQDPDAEVTLKNATDFVWSRCDVRLPDGRGVKLSDLLTVHPGDSLGIDSSLFSQRAASNDARLADGFALVRCAEGEGYLKVGVMP